MRGLALAGLLILAGPALAADPLQRQWRENREGVEAFAGGDFEAARDHFARRVEMAPRDARAHFNLGNALARLGRRSEAEAAWAEAGRLAGPGSLARDAFYNRGLSALEAGEFARAVEQLAEALAIDPADAEARRNLELALRRMDRPRPEPREHQDSGDQEPRAGEGPRPPERGEETRPQDASPPKGREPGAAPSPGEGEPPPADAANEEDRGRREGEPRNAGGERGKNEADPPSPPQDGNARGEADDDARERAERLLERLAESERGALEKELKRRIEEASEPREKGKPW